MNINREWTSKGNQISINVEIGNRGTFRGTLTNQAGTFEITRITVVQGRKVAPFSYNGKTAYQVLPDAVYSEIDNALRQSFELSEVEILEGEIDIAKREYHKALDIGPVQANKWLDEWNRLSAELRKL